MWNVDLHNQVRRLQDEAVQFHRNLPSYANGPSTAQRAPEGLEARHFLSLCPPIPSHIHFKVCGVWVGRTEHAEAGAHRARRLCYQYFILLIELNKILLVFEKMRRNVATQALKKAYGDALRGHSLKRYALRW